MKSDTHRRIYAVVARVPRGRVATYGQIARLAGMPGHARLVGYALHALPEHSGLPWHRIINAQGRISIRDGGIGHDRLQRVMLEREGIRFNTEGATSLARFQWRPRSSSTFGPAGIGKGRRGARREPTGSRHVRSEEHGVV